MIYYGQITYSEEFSGTKECVAVAAPYIGFIIIVEDGSLSDEQRSALRQYGDNVIIVTREWKDNFPEFRNHYLEKAREIAKLWKDKDPWMLVSDSDECFNWEFMRDISSIVQSSATMNYDLIGINCHEAFTPIEWLDDLDKLKESPGGYRESQFWKNLLFRLYPDVFYTGVGETKSVHETFTRASWKPYNLPIGKWWYVHRKSALKIWHRAAQNFFIGGGGNNVGRGNPFWKPFRELCAEHGIYTSARFRDALREGMPGDIEEKLIDFLWVTPTNYGTEMRETAKLYFVLHPDRRTPEIDERLRVPPPMPIVDQIKAFVATAYFECLGRHPDEVGLDNYASMIMNGQLTREELHTILRTSSEYQEKFGGR